MPLVGRSLTSARVCSVAVRAVNRESRNHSAEEKATAASITLISALIIPPITDALADPNLAGSDAFLNEGTAMAEQGRVLDELIDGCVTDG